MTGLIEKIRVFLAGKKTYLVSAGGVITALVAFAVGEITVIQTILAVAGALGLSTVRAAVTKIIDQLVTK